MTLPPEVQRQVDGFAARLRAREISRAAMREANARMLAADDPATRKAVALEVEGHALRARIHSTRARLHEIAADHALRRYFRGEG